MKEINKEKAKNIALAVLTGSTIGGVIFSFYWHKRYNRCASEGLMWTLSAINHMENQKQQIKDLGGTPEPFEHEV